MRRTAVAAAACALLCAAVASVACTGGGSSTVRRPDRESPEVPRRDPFAVVEAGAAADRNRGAQSD